MCVSVKCANETGMSELLCSMSEWTVFQSCFELTSDVIATPKAVTKSVEELLDDSERVLGSIE
jgi:hypothetical protein